MSDTPITDAGVRSGRLQSADGWLTKDSSDWVLAERARYLERELTAAQQENERLRGALRELVALKAIKEQDWMSYDEKIDYAKRKPLAWEAARRALGEEG